MSGKVGGWISKSPLFCFNPKIGLGNENMEVMRALCSNQLHPYSLNMQGYNSKRLNLIIFASIKYQPLKRNHLAFYCFLLIFPFFQMETKRPHNS